MASRTTLAARTTALLTGNGTVDYAADLDMNLTLDGWVTVGITGTKGSLTNIITGFYAGAAANPTQPIGTGSAILTETLTDATWTRSITLRTNHRYFRVSVAGTGADPATSDAVINYYYQPNTITGAVKQGVNVLST